jgi:hypothetical protein
MVEPTGSTRLLMYGCIVATAMVLPLGRWIVRDAAKTSSAVIVE